MFFQYKHNTWGRYGFADGINIVQGFRDWSVNGLDLGPMIISIENYRTGMVWKNFMDLSAPSHTWYIIDAFDKANIREKWEITVSSFYGPGAEGDKAFDGNTGTRWSSKWYDTPQWVEIDFRAPRLFNKVEINWEAAYATAYKIQASDNRVKWIDVYETTSSDGGIDEATFADVQARFLRVYATVPATGWGYSIWEIDVEYTDNLAIGKDTTYSNADEPQYSADKAVDGSLLTRWKASEATARPYDNIWMQVDFGEMTEFNKIIINYWKENGFSGPYYIMASDTGGPPWTEIYYQGSSQSGIDEIDFATPVNTRAIGLVFEKESGVTFSVWELVVQNNQ
jgi:hypothetical protein